MSSTDGPRPLLRPHDVANEAPNKPWWRDREMRIPVFSGIALISGLIIERIGSETAALTLFWLGLLLGASTFAPPALRKLFTNGSLGISLLMTISATGAVILGYVEEAAALAFLYSIVEALEDKAMDRARTGLRALLNLVPDTAIVQRTSGADDTASTEDTVEVPVQELDIGDLLVVRPGERVGTDGVITTGESNVDMSAITGESIPVAVTVGDEVPAGAINATGSLIIKATASGRDNSVTTIVKLVEQAQSVKGDRARLADKIAQPLVPGVMILAVLVAVIGSIVGDPQVWLTRSLVVLVAASPCALAIAVPLTVVAGVGAASKFGVVIKSGAAFEQLGAISHIAIDKTGTLTRNNPTVSKVITNGDVQSDEVLNAAAAIEQHSTHPLAASIINAAPTRLLADGVTETPGSGVEGYVGGSLIVVGSPRWCDPGPLKGDVAMLEDAGMTVVVVHSQGAVIGAIGIRDELRPEAPEVIQTLKDQELAVTMLTGDNARTATALAAQAGIDHVNAHQRPEDKAAVVSKISETERVAMIGDGINDAPALAAADVGIAMGAAGSDAAVESADVAITRHDLRLIPVALDHARRSRGIINQNICLSLILIMLLMPLAITGVMGLAAVVLVHEGAEVLVILNGLRASRSNADHLSV